MLKIEKVSASIAGITVLRDIDTQFRPGQLLAVVGRNGAGKTTLLRAIMGLLPLTSGRISISGTDLTQLAGHRRTEFGIRSEEPRLNSSHVSESRMPSSA